MVADLKLLARQTTYGEGGEWSDAGRLDQEDWFVGLTADMNLNLRGARLEVARSELDAEARRQVVELGRSRLADLHVAWRADGSYQGLALWDLEPE